MTIVIAPINKYPQFLPIVAKWYMSFWGEKYPKRTLSDWEDFIGKNSDEAPFTLIAFDNKNPTVVLGTASLKLNGMGQYKPDHVWLSAVFVPPEYRGKKIATTLINEVIDIARKKYPDIYLFTRTDGRIYKNLGWRVTEVTEFQETQVLIMKKSLEPLANNQFRLNAHYPHHERVGERLDRQYTAKL
ncbi:MAG TPA: GNAT family N-acetyltransferase [Coxiellaceae bacterium]|nr:MAG: hypothetical protein A3E81_01160 [Gammaproteobacteria bacterium RIFCSPHIGHO2_12_FULL_36_30]HLB56769.1 GNAT family N-acetyltransferase [Coxiellaceae bacterium]